MVKIAIFASGSGTNFENLINKINDQTIHGVSCELLIVDKEQAYAIERAKKLNIPYVYVNPKAYANKEEYETYIMSLLEAKGVQLIVLAGYMRYIGKVLLENYPYRIINIHPAYLPNFPGAHGIADTYNAGVEFGGVTVHYVDEGVDTGEIIMQEKVMIQKEWSLDEFEEQIHALEYVLYPKALQFVCDKIKEEK